MNAHIQSVATKLINDKLKDMTIDNTTKKISFAASDADAEAWVEEAMNKIKAKHCSVGAVTVSDMMKEVLSAPQGIKSVIKSKSSKSQKK